MRFRPPVVADGGAIWSLVKRGGGLDVNSPYAYLMACQNWSDTCVVAEDDDGLAGIVVGYRLADRPGTLPDTLFVWQIAIAPEHRGRGLGKALLAWLIRSNEPAWLETTITSSNLASRALFSGFARDGKVKLSITPWLSADSFPDQHEGEDLFRIGPFPSQKE
ncbi:diaminobutyrate acetyltransferase [Magnetospirillum sulfuroxidans]|uniref:L-2,4-diaminobutyric acid acetyltransferase n=1 Tax=Magnetospirillum sulfuroxidans TaxID=611300 RepID=A0ABS5IGF8_9PROT|nr:diaminobutyrate acetyltransferase [Magnetospirillum sulfuroxidans]